MLQCKYVSCGEYASNKCEQARKSVDSAKSHPRARPRMHTRQGGSSAIPNLLRATLRKVRAHQTTHSSSGMAEEAQPLPRCRLMRLKTGRRSTKVVAKSLHGHMDLVQLTQQTIFQTLFISAPRQENRSTQQPRSRRGPGAAIQGLQVALLTWSTTSAQPATLEQHGGN